MLGWKSPLLYMQGMIHYYILNVAVAPREGRVSRNPAGNHSGTGLPESRPARGV